MTILGYDISDIGDLLGGFGEKRSSGFENLLGLGQLGLQAYGTATQGGASRDQLAQNNQLALDKFAYEKEKDAATLAYQYAALAAQGRAAGAGQGAANAQVKLNRDIARLQAAQDILNRDQENQKMAQLAASKVPDAYSNLSQTTGQTFTQLANALKEPALRGIRGL